MSKFDVTKARSEADWYLEYPDEDKRLTRFAMRMRAACNEIEALRATFDKLERIRGAAVKLRYGPTKDHTALDDALAACDDGEGTP